MSWHQFDENANPDLDAFLDIHGTCSWEIDIDASVRQLGRLDSLSAFLVCDECGARYPSAVPVEDLPGDANRPDHRVSVPKTDTQQRGATDKDPETDRSQHTDK